MMNEQQTAKLRGYIVECAVHMARELTTTYGEDFDNDNVFPDWAYWGDNSEANKKALGEAILAIPGVEERIIDNLIASLEETVYPGADDTYWNGNLNDDEKLTVRRIAKEMVNAG